MWPLGHEPDAISDAAGVSHGRGAARSGLSSCEVSAAPPSTPRRHERVAGQSARERDRRQRGGQQQVRHRVEEAHQVLREPVQAVAAQPGEGVEHGRVGVAAGGRVEREQVDQRRDRGASQRDRQRTAHPPTRLAGHRARENRPGG